MRGWNRLRKSALTFPAVAVVLAICCSGCSGSSGQTGPVPSAEAQQAQRTAQTKEEAARQELDQILPPSKNLYLRVRSEDAYGNPLLIVHPRTVTLKIVYPDQNPKGFGTGGMLRPASARREQLELRLSDLATALASLPPDVWPYGRVVAVEESPSAPRSERIAIRRNVEATIQILNDLGVVVDEWTGSSSTLLR
jgi:hypothetical protein